MSFRYAAVLWFVLTLEWTSVKSLESVEELLCNDMEAGSRIPHPEFCNVYIICTDNTAMQISCERKVLYNSETEVCDADYQVCLGGLLRDQDGSVVIYSYKEDIETQSVTEILTDSSTKIESSAPSKANMETIQRTSTTAIVITKAATQSTSQQLLSPTLCPSNDSDKLLLISHATKCSVYFICYHGKPIPMECSMGLYWSERNYKCVPKELSECHARSANPYPRCPSIGIDFLPHDKFCDRFWYCRDGFRQLQQCDAFFQWDVNERKCKRTGQAVCYTDLLKTMIY